MGPLRCLVHCTWVILLMVPAAAISQPARGSTTTGYTVFLSGTPIGRESITISSTADATTISSQGRLTAPLDLTLRSAEFKYRPDGSPVSLSLDAITNGFNLSLNTVFADDMATTEGLQGTNPIQVSHPVAPQTIIHVNGVFASYAGLARRLGAAAGGESLRMYVVPQTEIGVSVKTVQTERMQIGTAFLDVRRYELGIENPGGELLLNLTTDDVGNLVRISIPSQSLDVLREDLASSTSRTQIYSNPGDEAVIIPAVGFNLGATITRPGAGGADGVGAAGGVEGAGQSAAGGKPRGPVTRFPAAVLLSGSGIGDRDGLALGIPTLAQLAGALADAGILAVRYDKRGNGQSGGRSESATMSDFAEDTRAVVRWLERRPDVDPKRIAVIGHSEGAWVALLAASREKKKIAAVVSIAGPASTGADLVLEQQQRALTGMNLPAEERDRRIALQKQIQSAVVTGKGWDTVPAELRRGADTPWFQSLLAYDPAKVVDDVKQPILLVHGTLDRQVPVEHAEKLSDLVRREGDSKSVELIIVKGVNHLMVPATTGEVSEYATLPDRTVSKDLTTAVSTWLTKTFSAIR